MQPLSLSSAHRARPRWFVLLSFSRLLALNAAASHVLAAEPVSDEGDAGLSEGDNSVSAEPAPDAAKLACARAYEQVQRLRRAGKLTQALDNAVACAQPSCPALLLGDCTIWVRELDASLPRVVFEARDAQKADLVNVSVFVDGIQLTQRLDGRAQRVDPGAHRFRFVDERGRAVERAEVIVEGNPQQRVSVEFPAEAPERRSSGFRPPAAAYALGALGVVGLGSFAYFGLRGNDRKQELRDRCEPRCYESEVAPVRRDYLIADVSLGVGIASLGVFAWLMLTSGSGAAQDAALMDVKASRSGAELQYRSRF